MSKAVALVALDPCIDRRRFVEEVDLDLDKAIAPYTDGPPRRNRRRIRRLRFERDRNGSRENGRGDLYVRDLRLEFEHVVRQ